ncbi:hypothetical protein ANCCAN_06143 [Ancylostoma caninum]|uniref:Uncharacterized protein n=1 Tax=Ancylostoma caninum TaxID=29170 RepID=A0A368GTU9_ANCCA|nr:hypothetical protein ANCCAN_06143 [Ancylostoma caninum]
MAEDTKESAVTEGQKPDKATLKKEVVDNREPFQPVPALFVPSQQRGRDVAVYVFPHDQHLCYEWYYQLTMGDNCTLTYMCCGCKALKTRNRKAYPRPVASCRIMNGYFVTDPLNPIRAHFCEPRDTTKATARRLIIERCNELRDGADRHQPASVELHELLSRISSEKFSGFSMEERLAMIEQITSRNENGRGNARKVVQKALQRAKNKRVKLINGRKRFRCILCASFRQFPLGRRPPFNRHHIAVLLAALMRYRQLSVDCAKEVYQTCSVKRKMLCKEHYVEAVSIFNFILTLIPVQINQSIDQLFIQYATSVIAEIKTTTCGPPGCDIDLNALHMSELTISSELIKHLNKESERFQARERLTARSVAFFLNDTMAYCVDRINSNEASRSHSSLEDFGEEEKREGEGETTGSSASPEQGREEEEEQKIMEILSNLAEEGLAVDVKKENNDEALSELTHPLILFSEAMRGNEIGTTDKPEPGISVEDESLHQSRGASISGSFRQLQTSSKESLVSSFKDRLFLVEGKKLLELFRHCPRCGANVETDNSSLQFSVRGSAPIVHVFCQQCVKEEGVEIRWEGISRPHEVNEEVVDTSGM